MKKTEEIIKKLSSEQNATDSELLHLINYDGNCDLLFDEANKTRQSVYGKDVYIRGLIEISNHCKNNCLYCGIRASNKNAVRYRLTKEQILDCCRAGYELGFRTFVMQGGEDGYYTDEVLCDIVFAIKKEYPDCAVTLSMGERSCESYQRLYDAGADRYLLRHETADNAHYKSLHPECMSLEERKNCLFALKKTGYQVGSGFMVGSPGQTSKTLLADLRFLQELKPDMIGIGPFIPHCDTEFAKEKAGGLEQTLKLIAILRLMFPYALIPATTALGTIAPDGRERAFRAGANVVMPNLSPENVRELYSLYNNKAHSGAEAAESLGILKEQAKNAGFEIVVARGDVKR